MLRIGNGRHDIGKRIWSELTHDATYTVVIRNCGMDELFFRLAVRPTNHFNGSRGGVLSGVWNRGLCVWPPLCTMPHRSTKTRLANRASPQQLKLPRVSRSLQSPWTSQELTDD